jgi:(2R)-3-sulfolactate dehydrogenase (NADP+)
MDQQLKKEEAEALITKALMANSVSEENARSVARALVAAEVDGQGGHGFSRVSAYAAQARSGKVAGHVKPTAEAAGAAFVRIDAGHGFAFPAIDLAIEKLAELAKSTGIAAAAITRSHHCGQLGAHVENLAERGLLALMVANTPKAMAPWGGNKPLFGTNPIAFAVPRRDAPPIVIDLSLSKIARGKIMAASKRGEAIPEGWALDADGNPTTDPKAALAGMMLPMGDAKGSALALIVEVLAATLTGANYSYQATSFFDADGPPPSVGQFIIAVNPNGALGSVFSYRLDELVKEIESQDGARLPGTSRLKARADCAKNGVPIPAHLLKEIERAIAT